jgi:hypothetical protein
LGKRGGKYWITIKAGAADIKATLTGAQKNLKVVTLKNNTTFGDGEVFYAPPPGRV